MTERRIKVFYLSWWN